MLFTNQIANWGLIEWLAIIDFSVILGVAFSLLFKLISFYVAERKREQRRQQIKRELYWLSHNKYGDPQHNWDINY